MTTIHHSARKIVREAIGSPCLAEIADLYLFRITGSKYSDEDGKFFLLPKIEHVVEQTGYSKRICQEASKKLESNGWIKRVRIRCFDGVVRTKIYITDKYAELMENVYQMFENANPPLIRTDICDDDENNDNGIAEINKKVSSYIKDQTKKRSNNSYKQPESAVDEELVKIVNFKFSFDLAEDSEAYRFVESLAVEHQLDFSSLLMALIDLQSTDLYQSTESLVNDAVASLKRIDAKDNVIPTSYSRLLPKKAIFHAEDERFDSLTPRQQLALSQLINDLTQSGKAQITNVEEVFQWIEYQITNPIHHFVSRGFKHCLNIVKKMLCLGGKQQYSKPFGFSV